MAPLRCAAEFDPFLSLDCAPTPSTLVQSKERKGSNFAIWQPWLQGVYDHVDDVDLLTGGLSERPVVGGTVGPTFACIIGQQFLNLRKGDRQVLIRIYIELL